MTAVGTGHVTAGSLARPDGDEAWLVREQGLDRARLGVVETQFVIGNGRTGTRATLDEGAAGQRSGVFVAGVYDGHDSSVADLVNVPDWTACTIEVDGVQLGIDTHAVESHERVLDLRRGLVWRCTVFVDDQGRRTRLESVRLASMARRELCLQRLVVTPEDHDARVRLVHRLDGDRRNLDRLPHYPDGLRPEPEVRWEKWALTRHLVTGPRVGDDDGLYLQTRTRQSGVTLGLAAHVIGDLTPDRREVVRRPDAVELVQEATLAAGRSWTTDRLVVIATDRHGDDVREVARQGVLDAAGHGVERLVEEHVAAWQELWQDCDACVDGDEVATRALRFGIYHLLITADHEDPTVNIGAKSLSGEGYRGHVFWDTEAVMLPFFVHTRPETARTLLGYRHHTLPAAREYAAESGCLGARYPWESAGSGQEECPKYTEDGQNRIWPREEQLHVTADVALGVMRYVGATGDLAFLHEQGAEILFETSRFWVDRATAGDDGSYSIRRVMGPDEFHSHVDDNAFTNHLVSWALRQAAATHEEMARDVPDLLADLTARIGLTGEEVGHWREVAERLVLAQPGPDGVIEQFAGYLDREDVPITTWDDNDMPQYPEGYNHHNCEDTMLLKQPDAVMLLHLLPELFGDDVTLANYDFYEARTLHKSSLSPAIHAVVALRAGRHDKAPAYFRRSALVDLADNQGNTDMGIHIASAAGTWSVLVQGFAGFRLIDGRAHLAPWLPPEWDAIAFRLRLDGHRLAVRIDRSETRLALEAPEGTETTVVVEGRPVVLRGGVPVAVPLGSSEGSSEDSSEDSSD